MRLSAGAEKGAKFVGNTHRIGNFLAYFDQFGGRIGGANVRFLQRRCDKCPSLVVRFLSRAKESERETLSEKGEGRFQRFEGRKDDEFILDVSL